MLDNQTNGPIATKASVEPTLASGFPSDDSILSAKQLSALMGPSLPTLSRWRSLGKGPPFIRLSKCSVGYPVGRYRRWVEAQTCETAPQ